MLALGGVTLMARKVGFKLYGLIPLLGFAAAGHPSFAFSGLTESFASLVLVGSILALLYQRPALGYLLASLLPYCRSEAKVLIPLFLVYGVYHRHFRSLPLLATGSLVFSLLGAYFLKDWAWIFNSPYKFDNNFYGEGAWYHYLHMLVYILEWPLALLAFGGTLISVYKAWYTVHYRWNEGIVVPLMAWTIVFAHSAVWALGIFGSAGLSRVLVLVLPLFFILALMPLERFYDWANSQNFKYSLLVVVLIGLGSYYGVHRYSSRQNYLWNLALRPNEEAQMIRDSIAPFINSHYPHFTKIVAESPDLGRFLNYNMLDSPKSGSWRDFASAPRPFYKKGVLLLWESRWAAVFYHNLDLLNQDPCFTHLRSWQIKPDGVRFELYSYNAACSP